MTSLQCLLTPSLDVNFLGHVSHWSLWESVIRGGTATAGRAWPCSFAVGERSLCSLRDGLQQQDRYRQRASRTRLHTRGPQAEIAACTVPDLNGFEDQVAVTCAACQGTAGIAWQMKQVRVQDVGKTQAAVEAKRAPKG